MKAIAKLKRFLRLQLRSMRDFRSGLHFAKASAQPREAPVRAGIFQPFMANEGLEHKIFNLRLAASRIENILVHPGTVFSFWKTVGNPDKGFREGRNIKAGVLTSAQGGGLCQASGILYHLSILCGLEVLERHNHSVDIYTDETRYTPLGTDATVVYGYKDLRIRNNLSDPILFRFDIQDEGIRLNLCTHARVQIRDLTFEDLESESQKVCTVLHQGQIINQSVYQKTKYAYP